MVKLHQQSEAEQPEPIDVDQILTSIVNDLEDLKLFIPDNKEEIENDIQEIWLDS
jgi:hypothetical protein